ncbi:hypothetical protein M0811_12806 [Anaeramoeba ignava]|uniref:Uncharacterized protein n=1 Tax=Anaeramoeba ignava TaxID=1746090 RepID=A0A9Q0R642_ANAIG|nr:hypothetical protein M0811_12806 [Anaeramoeba ignava]
MLQIYIFPNKKQNNSNYLFFQLIPNNRIKRSRKYHEIYFASFEKNIEKNIEKEQQTLKISGIFEKEEKIEKENSFYFFIQNPEEIQKPIPIFLNFIKAIHKFELHENFQNDSQQKKENAFWEGITSFIKYIFPLIKSNKLNFSIEQFFKSLIQDKELEMNIKSDFLKMYLGRSNDWEYLLTQNIKNSVKKTLQIQKLVNKIKPKKISIGKFIQLHRYLPNLFPNKNQQKLKFFTDHFSHFDNKFIENFHQKIHLFQDFPRVSEPNFQKWDFFNPKFHKKSTFSSQLFHQNSTFEQQILNHFIKTSSNVFIIKIISKFQFQDLDQYTSFFDRENTQKQNNIQNDKQLQLQKEKIKIKKKNYSIEDQICENIKNQRFFQNQTDKICLETIINSKIHLLIKDSPEFLRKFISEFTQDKCKSFIQNKNVKISPNQNQPKQILEEYFSDMELLQKIPQELISSDHNLSSNLQNYLSNIQNFFQPNPNSQNITFPFTPILPKNDPLYPKIYNLFLDYLSQVLQQKLQHLLIYKTICQEFATLTCLNENVILSLEQNLDQFQKIELSQFKTLFPKFNQEINTRIQIMRSLEIKQSNEKEEIQKNISNVIDEFETSNKIFENAIRFFQQLANELNQSINFFQISSQKKIAKFGKINKEIGENIQFNWDIFRIYIWEKANNYLKQRQKQKASLQEFQDILVQVIKEFLKYFQLLFSEEQLDSIFNGLSLKNNQNEKKNIIQNSFQNNENQNENIIQNSFQNNENQNEENIIQNSLKNIQNQNEENIIQNSFQLIRSFYPNLNFDQFKSLKSSFQKILENSNLNNFSELYNFFDKIKTKEFENIKDEFKLIQETIQQRKIEIEIEFEFEIENQNKFNQIFEQYGNSIEETKFFFYKLENEIEVYEIITTLYFGYCKHFPLKENVLICDFNQTKKSDIEKFINIYKFYNKLFYLNQNQNQKYLFSIIHSQRLSKKCSKFLLQELEKINYEKEICFPLIIFFYEKNIGSFDIVKNFPYSLISCQINPLSTKIIKKIFQSKSKFYQNKKVFTSQLAGMGKTYQIQKEIYQKSQENQNKYFQIFITNGNPIEFIEKINEYLNKINYSPHFKIDNPENIIKYLHIKLYFLPNLKMMNLIWNLIIWNLVESKRKITNNFIWNSDPSYFFSFEIPSNRKKDSENGLNDFPLLKWLEEKQCQFSSNEFSFTKYKLNQSFEIIEDDEHKQKMNEVAQFIKQNIDYFQEFENRKNIKDEKETFKFIQKRFSEKLPGQPLTYRLIMNFTQILKRNINFLNDYFSIENFQNKDETIMKKYFGNLLKFYFFSIINIVARFLKWSTKDIDSNSNILEYFSTLLKEKVKWEDRMIYLPIFSNIRENDIEMNLISNQKIKNLFDQNIQKYFDKN